MATEYPLDEAQLRAGFTALFATRSRDQWCALLEGSDACFAPVLSLVEAPKHPHNVAREAFVHVGGVIQPAPAPRYSGTPNAAPVVAKADLDGVLAELGYAPERIAALRQAGAIG